jgi:DNA end-binding protein Ku
MAARSSWKGYLKLSLVSVPVKAFNATTTSGSEIRLNQLHAACKSRIKYAKTCPTHGEVKQDEIVSAYEHAKDQYVVIDTEELDKLRTEDDKAIRVDVVIKPDQLDPMFNSGKTYYLMPDGPVANNSYALITQAMADEGYWALAQVVMHGHEQLVALRPLGSLLTMTVLHLDEEVTKPTSFQDDLPKVTVAPEELNLAKQLLKASLATKLDYTKYKDVYTEKLSKLIQAKVEGKEVVAAPAPAQAHVISLMDALRQSVAKASGAEAAPAEAEGKPPKKMAASAKKEAGGRKKKQA